MWVRSTPPVAARMQASTLGRMPPESAPVAIESSEIIGVGECHEARGILRIAEHAGNAGQVDQLLGAERDGDRFRHRVGVHVVHVAVVVAGEARHHGNEARVHERGEHARIDVHDVAHVPVVHDRGVAGVIDDVDRRAAPRGQQLGVHAGEAHRLELVGAERRQHVGVEGAGVDHLRHLERRVVGDAPSGHDHRLGAEPAREGGRLGSAAVDDDDADAEGVEQRDLGRDAVERMVVLDHFAAELHDEDVIAVGAHVAQGALEAGDTLVRIDHFEFLVWLLAAGC